MGAHWPSAPVGVQLRLHLLRFNLLQLSTLDLAILTNQHLCKIMITDVRNDGVILKFVIETH